MNEPDMTRSQHMHEGLLNEQSDGWDTIDQRDEECHTSTCRSCGGVMIDEAFDVWPDNATERLIVCRRCWECHGEPTEEHIDQIERGHNLVNHLDTVYQFGFADLLIEQAVEDLIAAFGPSAVLAALGK